MARAAASVQHRLCQSWPRANRRHRPSRVLLCLAVGAIAALVTQLTRRPSARSPSCARRSRPSRICRAARGPAQAVQTAGLAMKTALDTVEPDARAGRAQHAARLDRRLHPVGPGGPRRDRARRRARRRGDDLLLRHRELHRPELRARRRGVGQAAGRARPAAAHLRREAPRADREEPGRRLHGGVLDPRAGAGCLAGHPARAECQATAQSTVAPYADPGADRPAHRHGDREGGRLLRPQRRHGSARRVDGRRRRDPGQHRHRRARSPTRGSFTFVEEDTVEFKGLPGEHQLFSVEAA